MHTLAHRARFDAIAARFNTRWRRGYARNKLRFDPAYAAVAEQLAGNQAPILDIGCGLGLLGFYLRATGFGGSYVGIDFDAPKIGEARRIALEHRIDLEFTHADADALPGFSGNVVILDVLHYLGASEQQRLLRDAAERVAPGAVLVIRNVLREHTWRFHATRIEEYFLHATRWMRSPARHYPRREELESTLREAGLDLEIRPLWGNTPFNSFIVVARRGSRAQAAGSEVCAGAAVLAAG